MTLESCNVHYKRMTEFETSLKNGSIKGFGTYQIKDPVIIEEAIKNGYNFFDTAELYRNEKIVINAMKNSDKKLFVSTKISYIAIERGQIEKSFNERLKLFDGLKINLLLLHKPSEDCKRDWEILNDLYNQNRDKIGHIGVSNYDIRHLEQLSGLPVPFVNQIELSPFHTRPDLVDYCRSIGTIIVSHTSLTRNVKTNDSVIMSLANKYKISNAIVMLKWAIQNGYITIPRTSNVNHLVENADVYATYKLFNFSEDEMTLLNNLNEGFFLTQIRN